MEVLGVTHFHSTCGVRRETAAPPRLEGVEYLTVQLHDTLVARGKEGKILNVIWNDPTGPSIRPACAQACSQMIASRNVPGVRLSQAP